MKFSLVYNTSMTLKDCNSTDLKEIEWMYGRLVRQRKDERKVVQKESRGDRSYNG